jgi:COP9 signalosome complex subunit 7
LFIFLGVTADLPPLSPPQVLKLKYLTLATFAKSSRILPYATLRTALDIATIRELEDLIIDAIYQDVVRGKLDQRDQTFEVEWSMGRDVRDEELRDILQALKSWAESTSTILEALDRKISKIRDEEKVHNKMLEDHDKAFHDNLKEAYAKAAKDSQSTSNQAGARRNRQGGPGGSRDDAMDLDDPSEHRSQNTSLLSALRGKKK